MSLGRFDPNAPIDPTILSAARTLYGILPNLPAGDVTRLYGHVSCEPMNARANAYNIVVGEENGHYDISIDTDPRFNARSTWDENQYAQHTFHRNTGALGIALNGLDGPSVTPYDLGKDPPTVAGVTWFCAAVGAVAAKYGIDLDGLSYDSDSYYGEPTFLTHSEAGDLVGVPKAYDAYGPLSTCERFDWSSLTSIPPGTKITAEMVAEVGNALRLCARRYKVAIPH